jgi:5-methylcytosine-specific restriction endonuclease McrA
MSYEDWIIAHERIDTRRVAYERAGGFCTYCLCPVSKRKATIDHVYPVSRGGTKIMNGEINVVLACRLCNKMKGAMTLARFLKSPWLKERQRLVARFNYDEPPGWATAYRKAGQPRKEVVYA